MAISIQKLPELTLQGYQWGSKQEIGRSPNGITYKVRTTELTKHNGEFVAIRKFAFNGNKDIPKIFSDEFQRIRGISHPFILKYIAKEIYQDGGYVVMELCECSLNKYMESYERRVPYEVVQTVIKSMVVALETLKEHQVHPVYINPQNFLIKDGWVKFNPLSPQRYAGFASDLPASLASLYMAPKAMRLKKLESNDHPIIWSIGVIAYELAVGILPSHDRSEKQESIYEDKLMKSVILSEKFQMPKALRDFINLCLPKERKAVPSWNKIITHEVLNNCPERIDRCLSPDAAKFWNHIKKEKEQNKLGRVSDQEGKKVFYNITEHIRNNDEQIYCKEYFVDERYEIEKHDLKKKFKCFRLDEDNEYLLLWTLSKTIQEKQIDIYKVSKNFDFNKNEEIDYAELKALIYSILPSTKLELVTKVWDLLRSLNSGNITTEDMRNQLLGRLPNHEKQAKERAQSKLMRLRKAVKQEKDSKRKIFQYFDQNKDKRMDLSEFSSFYCSYLQFQRQEQIQLVFSMLDRNNNKVLSEHQLGELWKGA